MIKYLQTGNTKTLVDMREVCTIRESEKSCTEVVFKNGHVVYCADDIEDLERIVRALAGADTVVREAVTCLRKA